METPGSTLEKSLPKQNPLEIKANDQGAFRKIQIPLAKIGLGSMEGDLLFMLKKYLEIVGLVVFVWVLGKIVFVDRRHSIVVVRLFSLQCLVDSLGGVRLSVSSTSTNTIQRTSQNAR